MREKKCNVITCICWDSCTYISLSFTNYNNKCIPLTSRNFLLFFIFSLSVTVHLISHCLNARNKIFFPLVLYFGSSLLDNMENLEDTFRSLSRFVRGRHYVHYTLWNIVYINVDRILCVHIDIKKLQQINAQSLVYLRNYSQTLFYYGKHFCCNA